MNPSGSSPSYARPGRRVSQLGVSSRSESQRSVFHVLATSPRSRTTCSIDCSDNTRLTARPECPAPTMTTGMRRARAQLTVTVTFVGLVSASKTAERFCDWATSAAIVVGVRVGLDLEVDPDAVVAVAHLGVATEDAEDVHVALDRGLDRLELDAPVLRDRRDARGEAARQAHEQELDGRRRQVLGREDLRMVGLVAEDRLVVVIGAEAAVLLDRRLAVRAAQPLVRRPPGELGGLRRVGQGVAGVEQRCDVDSVVRCRLGRAHHRLLIEGWRGPKRPKMIRLPRKSARFQLRSPREELARRARITKANEPKDVRRPASIPVRIRRRRWRRRARARRGRP